MLRKTINSDANVLAWLEEYKDVTSISKHFNGGLEIDVFSKAFHKDTSDYSRIKNYLRGNGFDSFVGVATRCKVETDMSQVDYQELIKQNNSGNVYLKTFLGGRTLPNDVNQELTNKITEYELTR